MTLEINLDRIFSDDCVLPCQWNQRSHSHHDIGEYRLALAILRDALLCIVRPTGKQSLRGYRRAEAITWLLGAQDCYVSFDFVCAMLEIEDSDAYAHRLLESISRYKASGRNGSELGQLKLKRL